MRLAGALGPRTEQPNSYCWLRLASPGSKAAPTTTTYTSSRQPKAINPIQSCTTTKRLPPQTNNNLRQTHRITAPPQKASCHPQETVFSHAWVKPPGDRPPFGSGGSPRARPEPDCGRPRFRGEGLVDLVPPRVAGTRLLAASGSQARHNEELPARKFGPKIPPKPSRTRPRQRKASTGGFAWGLMTRGRTRPGGGRRGYRSQAGHFQRGGRGLGQWEHLLGIDPSKCSHCPQQGVLSPP